MPLPSRTILHIATALATGLLAASLGPASSHAQGGESSYPPVTLLLGASEDRVIHSAVVDDDYRISVALPLSYAAQPNRTYPVLYVLDPHLSFGTVTDVAHTGPIGGEMPELIVVGIGYPTDLLGARASRERDYHRQPAPFLQFIREELMPVINADYRTNPADVGIIGHSYGGEFVLYALFQAPDLFTRYLAGSPDFAVVTRHERAYAEAHSALPAQVVISVGSRDEPSSSQAALEAFVSTLNSRGYEGLDLVTLVFDGATHFDSRPLHHVSALIAAYGARR